MSRRIYQPRAKNAERATKVTDTEIPALAPSVRPIEGGSGASGVCDGPVGERGEVFVEDDGGGNNGPVDGKTFGKVVVAVVVGAG